MEEYGVEQASELEKYGWQLSYENGTPKWIKVSNFTDISNYAEITIDKIASGTFFLNLRFEISISKMQSLLFI